jgi:endonuclease G
VPSAYFKVIYDSKGHAASFVFDQDLPRGGKYCEQKISYKDMNSNMPYSMPSLVDSSKILQRLGC